MHRPARSCARDWSGCSASAEPQIQVVGEIGDARDVVDAVRVLEPDVVLLELQMPGLDGARLTSYIRAGSPTAAVLLMADDGTDELLREADQRRAPGAASATTSTGPAWPVPCWRPPAARSLLSENALLPVRRPRDVAAESS